MVTHYQVCSGSFMRRALRSTFGLLAGISVMLGAFGAVPTAELVVHEWGTITTVHAADGTPQVGLNKIDESDVLPPFVHRYEPESTRFDPAKKLAKSPLVPGRPDVSMRLETPVIYFHPPAGFDLPFDVSVLFRGGVINEFYPSADAAVYLDVARIQDKQSAGAIPREWTGETLNNFVLGSLRWQGVRLHATVVAPLTTDPVWLAPREPQSASVYLPSSGEGERYLFYRGVAALGALLQTRHSRGAVQLLSPPLPWLEGESLTLPNAWLVEVGSQGAIAFREHGAITLRKSAPGKQIARLGGFGRDEITADNLKLLRASLKTSLIRQGLFADEAEALLNTWKHSYFEKPGLRVFYIVPRAWTDHFLPLTLSVPARVNRVMVGRIDLVP